MSRQPNPILWAKVRLDLSVPPNPASLAALSTADQERAARFRREEDRHRFRAGRALVLMILQAIDPDIRPPLEFALTEHGRPYLPQRPEITFSISHAGELVVAALARDSRVGIDVEGIHRRVDLDSIAPRIFNPADLASFRSLEKVDQPAAFFRAWTTKEAILKAKGVGLFGGLESISAPFDHQPSLVCEDTDSWRIFPLELPSGYCGTLACEKPNLPPVEMAIYPSALP